MQEIQITLNNGLFPFKLNDLLSYHYADYHLQNVFESITEEQRQACVNMWLRNKVIPTAQAAYERSKQVCYFITEASSGELIGVNTLYVDQFQTNSPPLFFNRIFIKPKHRTSRIMITGTAMMLCFAKMKLEDRGISGVVNVNENPKLSRPGMHRIFSRLGYRRQGYQNGQEVLYFEFAKINFLDTSK